MAKKKSIKDFEVQRRTKMVGVKLTQAEYETLELHCEEIGVTKSRYFRYLFTEAIRKVK